MAKLINFEAVDLVKTDWYYNNGRAVWWRDGGAEGKVKARMIKGYHLGRPVIRINGKLVAFMHIKAVDDIEKILNVHYFKMLG